MTEAIKIKKYIICLMMAIGLNIGALAETGKMSIAVLELDANGVAHNEARALTDRLRIELFNIGKFDVMEREKMDAILNEQKLLASGAASIKNIIEIGRLISVNGMVCGSIGKLGNKYLLSVQLVDVETGMILATATEECSCPLEDLTAAMDKVAQKLASVEKRAEFTIQYYDKNNTAKGNFYIKSSPAGATVYINDKMIRNVVTPLTIEDLPSGTYKIRAEKDNYAKSAEVTLQINEFKKIELVLEKKQGKLVITANIPQSDVYLSEQFLGKTPLEVKVLDVGTYRLRVKKGGYIEFTRPVEISDVEETRLDLILIKPGPLKVLSVPMEAEIYLDNERKGATPIVLTNLSPEPHVMELRKEGYKTYRESITISTDQETKVEPVLEPLAGTLPVSSKAERSSELGSNFDQTLKWITIGGGTAFAVILSIIMFN